MNDSTRTHFENVITSNSIAEAFWRRANTTPDALLYRYAVASSAQATRVWREETYSSVSPKIARIARFLAQRGVGPGTPVAILSYTRPEWMLVDIAIQTLGGITVSIYQSLPAIEVGFILHDSGARIVFIENDEQAHKVAWLRAHRCPIPERESIPASEQEVGIDTVITFEQAAGIPDAISIRSIIQDETLSTTPPAVPAGVSRTSVASYVYTSGTTGPPKGVVQTNGNHLINVEQASESGVFAFGGSMFLYLPLAHSFARLAYYVGFLTSTTLTLPAVIDHTSSKLDLSSIARDIREGSSTVLPSVPRLFEKMASTLQARASGKGLQSKILGACIGNARRVQTCRENGSGVGMVDAILFRALGGIRRKIRNQLFGPNFHHAISGGAKLDPEVNRFFDALGIVICEGYGLTETCVATHVNLPDRRKIGSVGPAFRGIEVRIADSDGEISMRGPNIAQGYLHRPQATQEAWSADGWFHTGDIGRIDSDGFLFITDRKKELVITAGGKKIPPTSVEWLFKRNSFISQAFLYGEGRPYCIMLFTLNELDLRAFMTSQGIEISPSQKLSRHPAVVEMIETTVGQANEQLASYETIKRYAILDEDFSVENGLLTPTMKMKRKVITERYREQIESLYA